MIQRIPPPLNKTTDAVRQNLLRFCGGAAVLAGGIAMLRHAAAWPVRPFCFFHALTGWYCPGCGATRALCALSRGDLDAACHYNPLLIALLPLLVYAAWQPLRLAWIRPVWIWTLVVSILLFSAEHRRPTVFGARALTHNPRR